jgi:ATP-dependent Clp protease ATP-binding subunit ClpA
MQEQGSQFDSFVQLLTPESLRVLDLAREEALNLKHNFIGTEHLLWGLASEGSLAPFLTPLGVTPERIHGGLVFLYERQAQWNPSAQAQWNQSAGEAIPSADAQLDVLKLLTPRAKEMIVLAGEEAKNQGDRAYAQLIFCLVCYRKVRALGPV